MTILLAEGNSVLIEEEILAEVAASTVEVEGCVAGSNFSVRARVLKESFSCF
jgi:hypothetical protein